MERPKMELGLYWAERLDGTYNLVKVEDADYRPDSWFNPDEPKVEVFQMGWDCSSRVIDYKSFIKAVLTTPDGDLYE